MMKGPKTLLAEGITAALDEFFEVDPDAIEAKLLGETQILLKETKLRPRTTQLLEKQVSQEVVSATTTGVVEQVLFTWTWASLGNDYLVKDSRLQISGLRFQTRIHVKSTESDSNDTSNGTTPLHTQNNANTTPSRRRSSLAEIKQEGLLEAYIRHQVEHIIDALTLCVQDFEFSIELPPNTNGEISEITARGSSVELKSVGGTLGDESHVRHRASFVNGGLCQQLSFGSIQLGVFTSSEKELPLLEPLSYQLSATRFFGERFSGLLSGISGVGMPLSSTHYLENQVEETDIVVHAGLDQIRVLVDLGNLLLQKKTEKQVEAPHTTGKHGIMRDEDMLRQDTKTLVTLYEEEEEIEVLEEEEIKVQEEVEGPCPSSSQEEEEDINGIVWYPSLNEQEWREIEQDYSDYDKGDISEDMYSTLMHDLMKSSVFRFPITGISLVLPNKAKLTLEALCVNYRADGTVMSLNGEYGAGILIDGFQLVNTSDGSDGAAKSCWVFDLISSRFTIEEEENGSGSASQSNSKVARIRWTETKLNRLIKGWTKLMDAIKGLNLEKRPGTYIMLVVGSLSLNCSHSRF